MSVIKLLPSFKDYLWGGVELKSKYGKDSDLKILAESWEVSTHADGPSYVASGEFKGLTLLKYLENKNFLPLGSNNVDKKELPVLIKFIDALQDLSIQVHPDDNYSKKHENALGKTEMWYVLEAKPNAKIYFGSKEEMSQKEFKEAIENDTILDKLVHKEVFKGDVIFVEAGSIHAIGAGIIICEIQQNSNITYRLYDFNRKDDKGDLRELHIDKAVAVSNLKPLDTNFNAQKEKVVNKNYSVKTLVDCEYFKTDKIELDGKFNYDVSKDSFEAVIVIEGEISITHNNQILELNKGDSAFIDANTQNISILGKAKYLSVTV